MLCREHGDVERNPGPPSSVVQSSDDGYNGRNRLSNSNSNSTGSGSGAAGQPQSRRQPQSTAPAGLSFLSTNAHSLLPKIEELSLLVAKVKPSLIFVTETWLNDSVPDSALSLPGYSSLVRRDHVGRRGRGALIFIQDCLHFSRRPDLEHWHEDIWIELTPSGMGNRRLLFGCFYPLKQRH